MTALLLTVTCIGAAACTGAGDQRAAGPPIPATEWESLLAAEDARIATRAQRQRLHAGLESDHAFEREAAVRALGRTERAEFRPAIALLLHDSSTAVRAAAAHALGSVMRDTMSPDVLEQLLAALPDAGTDDTAAAAVAETLGRLRVDSVGAAAVAVRLTPFLEHDNDTRLGALRGLFFLARQPPARAAVSASAAQGLRAVSVSSAEIRSDTARGSSDGERATRESDARERHARERGLALATLALTRAADEQTLSAALQDAEPQVRREAAAAAATMTDTAAVRRVAGAATGDVHPAVRYEGVRVHASRLAAAGGCATVAAAARDSGVHVALLAIDLLGTACRAAQHAALLDSLAGGAPGDTWHRAAHAVVSLARVEPARARAHVSALARHANPFARTYAAHAAAATADTALLLTLAADTSANVRTAAVTGLTAVARRAADSVYVAQLASDESELLMAAAAALEGSTGRETALRLLDALDRVTALQRETSRDGRMALLERVQELGGAHLGDRLTPYLSDFDPDVAERAAATLEAWTGNRPRTAPVALSPQPLPSYADAVQLTQRVFVLELEDGGEIEIRLLPYDAPTNAARFARLSRSGYFDGLTIHRIAPNFVVQGGSPGANEYTGDGPFTRDELRVPNWRGTVGLSTRGRDTGDAQFYINLIDNVRLDHDYTVFGVVTSGMDVVDRLAEGAVIRRIREQDAP